MMAILRAFRLGMFNIDLLKQIVVKDLRSGMVVGIIALPMSVGIALASGFPPFSGILASLIGGLIVSFLSGSRLSIKGPAGGLSALTFSSVIVFGQGDMWLGYGLTLAVIVVSGILQVISSFAKMGNLGDFFPAAAIHGMLAALGFIMVVKQIPPLLGTELIVTDTLDILSHLPTIITSANPKIAFLGMLCLTILGTFRFFPESIRKYLPSVILMLALAIPIGLIVGLNVEHSYLIKDHTFNILPKAALVTFPSDFLHSLSLPNFSRILSVEFWFFAVAFSLAGNIESLITCKAVDNIDPWHRQSDFNKDLMAIGVGNILSGFLGGLPMISESKRSVVNVNLGGSTIASNFFHALILLLIIFAFQPIIRLIPVCALSAYLIYAGLRMTMPKEFSKSYSIGKDQFIVFLMVFACTILFNLLIGIVVGVLLELCLNLRFVENVKSLFKTKLEIIKSSASKYEVSLKGPATFSNFLLVKKELRSIPKSAEISFDFSKATLLDHSFLENLTHYEYTRRNNGGSISYNGLDYHHQVSSHPLATRRIVTIELSERQIELGIYAKKHEIGFENRRLLNVNYHDQFLSSKWLESFEENKLTFNTSPYHIEAFDLGLVSFKDQNQKITVTAFTVKNIPNKIPNLILQQEGFIGLFDIENTRDINFREHPVFSYYYYLTGSNEELIRSYFSNQFIIFFEQHKGFHIHIKDGTMFLYKRADILSLEEISQSLSFIDNLLRLMDSKV